MQAHKLFGAGRLLLAAGGLLLVLVGCGDFIYRVTGGYTGPQPSSNPLVEERVIVRAQYQEQRVFYVERARFTDAKQPHNVNRVVKVTATDATYTAVLDLEIRLGDTLIVSTDFERIAPAVGSMGVPNWPGHGSVEYPISAHLLTDVRRVR